MTACSLIRSILARVVPGGAWCGWHDLVQHHGHSGDPEVSRAAGVFVMTLIGIAIVGLLSGTVGGFLVVTLTRKIRHLFWAIPAANLSLYAIAVFVRPYPGGPSAQFRMPGLVYAAIEILFVIFQSLALACVVAVCYRMVRAVRGRSTGMGSGQDLPAQGDLPRDWQRYLNAPHAASRRSAFQEGFFAPRYGFAYLADHRKLWSYAIIPIALNLVITALAFVLLLLAAGGFAAYLHPRFSPDWTGVLLEVLSAIALLALALLATLVTWTLLQGILCGHFYGKLARKVEIALGVPAEELQELPLYREAADAVADTSKLIFINVGLLTLHVIPVLGSIVGIGASLYFDCCLFGREYLDFPLSLRGRTRRERQAFARQFRGQTAGLGAAALLMTLVPIIGSIALTTAVVGGVLLHRRLAATAPGCGSPVVRPGP